MNFIIIIVHTHNIIYIYQKFILNEIKNITSITIDVEVLVLYDDDEIILLLLLLLLLLGLFRLVGFRLVFGGRLD